MPDDPSFAESPRRASPRWTMSDSAVTPRGVVGTPSYMPPEQARCDTRRTCVSTANASRPSE